jgi:hypothetical protein
MNHIAIPIPFKFWTGCFEQFEALIPTLLLFSPHKYQTPINSILITFMMPGKSADPSKLTAMPATPE